MKTCEILSSGGGHHNHSVCAGDDGPVKVHLSKLDFCIRTRLPQAKIIWVYQWSGDHLYFHYVFLIFLPVFDFSDN